MIVAFDRDQRIAVLDGEIDGDAGEFHGLEPLLQLGALQARLPLDDLDGTEVAVDASAGRIDTDDVPGPRLRRQEDVQRTAAPDLGWQTDIEQPSLDAVDVEAAVAGGAEAGLRIFGKLLRAQRMVALFKTTTEADLFRRQTIRPG